MTKTIVWRIIVALAMLVMVWMHCHWSVALVITFLWVSNEFNSALLSEVSALLNEVVEVIKARGEAR